jgi:outer membrane lipoprotein-sorting protein
MRFLRLASTRRLVAVLAAVAALAGGAAAIAIAATGSGPTPPPKPLPEAVHDALAAAPVEGVTARIDFTNGLIDASSLRGQGNALLSGATGRLWAAPDGRLRLELQSDAGDGQIVVGKDRFHVYDASTNTVYEGALPQQDQGSAADHGGVPTVAKIQDTINKLSEHWTVSGAEPGTIAGRAAYTVRLTPRHDGGLLGAGELGWDAATGIPLRAAIYAQGQSGPTLELKATDVKYGPVDASTLDVPAPAGAKVTHVDTSSGEQGAKEPAGAKEPTPATGVADVQAKLPFKLSAPATLAGLPRKDVQLVHIGDTPTALVTYGEGLGGIAVLESATPKDAAQGGGPQAGGPLGGLELPKLSINGATGSELATALGTILRFDRDGVSYTVAGSVPAPAAEAAARGL